MRLFRCFILCLFQFFISVLFSELAYPATKPFSIMLDWELNPDHAPLWVAQQYGFFAQQGLNVKLIPPADPADPAKFAAAGKVDLSLTYEPQWIMQQSQGLPLVWVGTLINQPLAVLISNAQIKSLQDLKGKTIGYSSGAIDRIFLCTMLQHEEITLPEVKLINLHYDLLQALVAKRIAAMTGAMRNVEPLELKQKHFAFNLFKPEDYGIPPYAELIFVTAKQNQNNPRLTAFIKALEQGIKYLKEHPEQTWEAFAIANPALNDEANHQIWLTSVKYFTPQPGIFDQAQYQTFKSFLLKQNLLKSYTVANTSIG